MLRNETQKYVAVIGYIKGLLIQEIFEQFIYLFLLFFFFFTLILRSTISKISELTDKIFD